MVEKKSVEKKPEKSAKKPPENVRREDCCHILGSVLDHAKESVRTVAGLQQGHVLIEMKRWWSPIVYVLPNRGRGKAQIKGFTAIMAYCPFCGKKQPGRPSDE